MNWDSAQLVTVLDGLEHVLTSVAIVVGGVWSYLKFIKGQILVPKLDLSISADFVDHAQDRLVIITCEMLNASSSPVNLKKILIQQEGTALRVFVASCPSRPPHQHSVQIDWQHVGTFCVFENHSWLASEEKISDFITLVLPRAALPLAMLQLRVVSKGMEWNAAKVVRLSTAGE